MDFKKDTQGNQYIDVAAGPGNGKIRVTYLKGKQLAAISAGDQSVECKVAEIPALIEALAQVFTASMT